jgi:hypothetical protein
MTAEHRPEEMTVAPKTRKQQLAECVEAGHWVDWRTCWDCGGECYTHHDCGEDTCCCLRPEDNVSCDTCEGAGGWEQCRTCYKGSDWDD